MKRVIIIGGGASGLAAAIAAGNGGAQVTVLERLPRVGKKILLTGNGRCNLGNAQFSPERYHGTVSPTARAMLQNFDAAAYFEKLGLLTRADAEGRLYPYSKTAASVLDALRFSAEAAGAQILCEKQVTDIKPGRGQITVLCGSEAFTADAVIAAAGGAACPSCGTDGSLYPVLERLGHRIIKPVPALCPIPTDPARVKPMKGMRVNAAVTVLLRGKPACTETGELQFGESALSGICVFNLARVTALHPKETELSVNLLPEFDFGRTEAVLAELFSLRGQLPAADALTGILPKRIAETLLKQVFGKTGSAAELADAASRQKLAQAMQDWRFPVRGVSGFAQAQVTAGGVSGQSITKNLESKTVPGLFFCGELLDADGDCGGLNLAWAWKSGETAGRQCLHSLSKGIASR